MWEGRGCQVSKNKFEKYSKEFTGGLFIIATNDLPPFADSESALHNTQWLPMQARCEIVHLQGAKEGTTPFPYDVYTLAKAIQHRVNHWPLIEC